MMARWGGWLIAGAGSVLPLLAAGAAPVPVARPAAFGRCASCHSTSKDGNADVGPNLYGVVGSKAGARPGYDYSAALKASGIIWTQARVAAFIADPQAMVKGTQMPDPGIKKPADREAIAAWLATLR